MIRLRTTRSLVEAAQCLVGKNPCMRQNPFFQRLSSTAHPPQPIENGAKEYISFDAKTPVLLRMEDDYPGNRVPETVPAMFRRLAKEHPQKHAVAFKESPENDTWTKLTYPEYLQLVEKVSRGFIALGLEESHSVGVMANNCVEWTTASHAAIFAGGLICGIYQTSSPDIVSHLAKMSDMDILVVENLAMLKQAVGTRSSLKEALPSVKVCVMIEAPTKELNDAQSIGPTISWENLLTLGKESNGDCLEIRERNLQVNKACILVFTSGTTGPPKGAMISHDNATYCSYIACTTHNWKEETTISYLPMSHVAAHIIDNYLAPFSGGTSYFADKDCMKGTLVENMKSVRPTKFTGVPRVWEKIKDKMMDAEAQASPLKKAIMNWAKSAALENHQQVMEGKREYGVENGSLKYRLAHKIVLSKIHLALGLDRTILKINGRNSGGAAISETTLHYFTSIGLFINQLFGATESTGPLHVTRECPGGHRDGTCGKPYIGVKTKLIDVDPVTKEGEIAFSCRNTFMGYIKEEAKTRDTFTEDGLWCKTGDMGIIDADGHLKITGRIKELLITEGGKNIAPVPIEEDIKSRLTPIISNAMVVGDSKKYLSCLFTLQVTVDPATLLPTEFLNPAAVAWCKSHLGESKGGQVKTTHDFIEGPYAEKLRSVIQKSINEYNEKSAETQVHKVKDFCILPHEFSFQTGELGPTLKVKRHVVTSKYKTSIEEMYSDNVYGTLYSKTLQPSLS